MSDEIQQRIQYLVEHGGLFDDPIEDLRRNIRVLFYMTGTACCFGAIGLLLLLR